MQLTETTLDEIASDPAMYHHLRYNHFPALPLSLIPACRAAIAALEDEAPNRFVSLPNDLLLFGTDHVQAWQLVAACHLEDFVDTSGWDADDADDAGDDDA